MMGVGANKKCTYEQPAMLHADRALLLIVQRSPKLLLRKSMCDSIYCVSRN